LIVDNMGLPARVYNLAFSDGSTIGVNDGVILISLKDGHRPTADYVREMRRMLPNAFPDDVFYFQPADMVTQILNFGLTAQIDVRTVGYDRVKNLQIAQQLRQPRSPPSPALPMPISSRKSTGRSSMPTSTAVVPPSLASTSTRSLPTSMSASVRPSRSHPISGRIRNPGFPIILRSRPLSRASHR
jgi:hypothetical protein